MARDRNINLANWSVAILAGGLATRLRPATNKIPKALLPVADEPFLVHQLRLLYSEGFRKIVLCVGYLGEMIEAQKMLATVIDLAQIALKRRRKLNIVGIRDRQGRLAVA